MVRYILHFAGEQGFEPRSATLKAAVLPLNHSPPRVYIFVSRTGIKMKVCNSYNVDYRNMKGLDRLHRVESGTL